MPRHRNFLILAVLAVTCVPARGADAPAETPHRFLDATGLGKRNEPISVTSDRLDYDYRGNVVVYRGAVQATQGRLKITSDTLTVTFADGKDGASAPPAGLRIEDGTRWATGGRAVFDQTNRTLVLSEAPMMHDGANEVLGDRVIVYLDEDRSVVEGGRKRVKAVLYPDRDEKTAGTAAEPKKKGGGGGGP